VEQATSVAVHLVEGLAPYPVSCDVSDALLSVGLECYSKDLVVALADGELPAKYFEKVSMV
tara:strand:+ start:294 stop:476 length:183 start_codon:yes stop_codon:yes gene_type:complete